MSTKTRIIEKLSGKLSDSIRDTPETPGGKPVDPEIAALVARLEALPDGAWLHDPETCPDCLEKDGR